MNKNQRNVSSINNKNVCTYFILLRVIRVDAKFRITFTSKMVNTMLFTHSLRDAGGITGVRVAWIPPHAFGAYTVRNYCVWQTIQFVVHLYWLYTTLRNCDGVISFNIDKATTGFSVTLFSFVFIFLTILLPFDYNTKAITNVLHLQYLKSLI